MKNFKKTTFLSVILLIVVISVYCKQHKSIFQIEKQDNTYFLGDSILSDKNFFSLLTDEKEDPLLKKHNEKYLKIYSNMKNGELFSMSKIVFQLDFLKKN